MKKAVVQSIANVLLMTGKPTTMLEEDSLSEDFVNQVIAAIQAKGFTVVPTDELRDFLTSIDEKIQSLISRIEKLESSKSKPKSESKAVKKKVQVAENEDFLSLLDEANERPIDSSKLNPKATPNWARNPHQHNEF